MDLSQGLHPYYGSKENWYVFYSGKTLVTAICPEDEYFCDKTRMCVKVGCYSIQGCLQERNNIDLNYYFQILITDCGME